MQQLGLMSQCVRIFSWHPWHKRKSNVMLQLTKLVTKLEGDFVSFKLMNAPGIVYPQF
jgi:hypothetical protein